MTATSPAAPADSVPLPAVTLEEALRHSFQAGVAEHLRQAAWADPLAEWLHRETGIRRVWLKLGVKLLATLTVRGAEHATLRAGSLGVRAAGWLFRRIPGQQRLLAAFMRLDRATLAEQEFERVLSGEIAPRDARLTAFLSRDRRVQFVTQSWLHQIADAVHRQPFLDLTLHADVEANRFLYTARRTRLLGREDEIRRLEAFLDAPPVFRWWTVAGAGGVGKSRLALEWALRSSGRWRIGLLRTFEDFDWAGWRPRGPTALIADYATEKAETLGSIAQTLHARAAQGALAHPVRILLLVRDTEEAWTSRLYGTGTRRASLMESRYAEPLEIPPLNTGDLWSVLTSLVPDEAPLPDRDATLAKLAEIDPQGRPLFALFAGDAIAHGREIRGWDQAALVRDVLEREKEHWRAAGATEHDHNLLALTTLTAGLPTEVLAGLDRELFPAVDARGAAVPFRPERFRAMSGYDARETLMPLLPDILGELFVLEHLAPRFAGDEERAATLRELAWRLGSAGIFSFLTRAAADFPAHESLRLLDPPPQDEAWLSTWCIVVVNVASGYGVAGQADAGFRIHDALHRVSVPASWAREYRMVRALTAGNLFVSQAVAGRFDRSVPIYEELRALSRDHPDEEILHEMTAKAARNLAFAYVVAERLREAEPVYGELRALSARHPLPEVLEHRMSIGANLVVAYDVAGETGAALALHAELREVARLHAGRPALREMFARAALRLVTTCADGGQVEDALACAQDLRRLAEEYPDDAAVVRYRAQAAATLTALPLSLAVVEQLHAELRALHQAHPELRESLAEGAARLAPLYGKHERWSQAAAVYQELQHLAREHPVDQAVKDFLGGAAANLATARLQSGQFADAARFHDQLLELAGRAPSPSLHLTQAESAKNLTIEASNAGRLDKARRYFQQVWTLAGMDSPSQPPPPLIAAAVRRAFASAASGLVRGLGDAGFDDEARHLYERLHALARENPSEEKLFEEAGRAACMLIWDYLHDRRTREIVHLYEEVRSYPDFSGVAQWRAKAGADALWQMWYADDPAALLRSLDEYRAFCLGASGDAQVRKWFARTADRVSGQWQESTAFRAREALARIHGVPFEEFATEAMPHVEFEALGDPVANVDDDAVALRIRGVYRDLEALSHAHPDDAELRGARGSTALKLLTALWTVYTIRSPELLGAGADDEAAFLAWRANARACHRAFLSGAGGDELAALHEDLAALSRSEPGNAERRGQYAQSLGLMLGLQYFDADPARARDCWRNYHALIEEYPEDTPTRGFFATATLDYWTNLMIDDRVEEASGVFDQMRELAAAYPGDPRMTAAFAELQARLAEAEAKPG